MFVTGLTRIMKAAGVPYEVVAGWEKRSLWRAGLSNNIKACMWHDTQSADASFATGRDAPTLGYVTSGLGYPLYNVLFGRSGKAYIVAAGSCAHAGRGSGGGMTRDDANRESIAFSFDANQSRYPVTAAQLESAARVGKAMTDDWGGRLVHIMHGEWNPHDRSDPTRIPGGWAGLKAAIKRGYWSAKPATPKPVPVVNATLPPAVTEPEKEKTLSLTNENIRNIAGAVWADRSHDLNGNNNSKSFEIANTNTQVNHLRKEVAGLRGALSGLVDVLDASHKGLKKHVTEETDRAVAQVIETKEA